MRIYRNGRYYYRKKRKRRRRSHQRYANPRDAREFVQKCLFNLSSWQFVAFTDYYESKYGSSATNYLKRTYEKWKSGETEMSGQTGTRILECVPRFLGRDEQFQMLQFYIPSILSQWKAHAKARSLKIEELDNTFTSIAKKVMEDDYTLHWFVRNVFSQEEIDEFIGVLRYTMLDTLKRSYNCIRDDISFIYSNVIGKLSQIEAVITLEYVIDLLGCRIELSGKKPLLEESFLLNLKPPNMVTKFNAEYREILLDYSINCIKHDAHDSGRKHIGLYDLDSLLSSLKKVRDDNEYTAGLSIEGSGGSFSIKIERKNQLHVQFEILKRAAILALVLIVLALAYIFLTDIVLPLSYFIVIGMFYFLAWSIGGIRDSYKEMKKYEQRKTNRFAEN